MTNGVFDLRKVIRAGLIAGLVMIFTSAIGMVEDFDGRQIVDQLLSLGFLALFWFVPRAGYSVGSEEVLEGMEAHDKSTTNVVAGALVGLVAGLSLSVFVIITNALDLRDVFTRLSPKLVAVLTFSDNVADPNLVTGILILIAISVLLGAIGGALHLVSDRLRKQIVWAVLGVVVAALLEDVFAQILRTFGLTSVVRSVYRNGALRIAPAVVVSVASFFIAGRKQRGGSAVRKYLAVADPKERTKRSVIVAAVALAIIAVAPWVLGSLLSEILATTGIFLLMGLGLNIVVGFAGLLDLGYVAFFAVGAYTSAILTSPLSPFWSPEWPWWYTLPIVVVVSMLAGLFVGTPVIRLRGDYLAIVTLGFGEIVRIVFLSDAASGVFGGAGGIRNIPGIPLGFDTVSGSDPQYIMYFAAALVILAAWVSYALLNSRVGRAWTAMREDESVAEVMGINTVTAKLSAFIVGAVLAGLGGALFSAKLGSIFPTSFELLISIVILVVVIVGGMGNIVGVAAGAVVLIGVLGGPRQPGLLQEFGEFKLLIYGVILIYMMLKRPEGLIPNVRRSRELHHDEMSQDAWLKAQSESDDTEGATA
ncbi:MAG: branched-chain amino acid ABC transporter permease [Acidimicrobiia bacterium]|nr:branched-chain amino acid ABC transporter permease [Acidimicrobiia bacterium]